MVASTNAAAIPEDELLRKQIVQAEQQLSALQRHLKDVDEELDGLGTQRETFELLEQACGTLETLESMGSAHLFWGEGSERSTAEHVREARERAGRYLSEVSECELKRGELLEKIREGEDVLAILEADLYEYELAEEERKQEWVVERELVLVDRPAVMPWSSTDDDQRMRKSMLTSLLAALALGAVVPLIDLPLPDLELLPEVPDRFARLIEQELPPPPPVAPAKAVPPSPPVAPEAALPSAPVPLAPAPPVPLGLLPPPPPPLRPAAPGAAVAALPAVGLIETPPIAQ